MKSPGLDFPRAFATDRRGGTTVIVALSIVPVCASIGLSVDLGRLYLARTYLQDAADAAALDGAQKYRLTNSPAAASGVAQASFAANSAAKLSGATSITTVDTTTKTVSVSASYSVTTSFIQIVAPGKGSVTISANAGALVQNSGLAKNLEVSVMLDVTTSMSQSSGTAGLTKLQAMKNSASNLVDTVVQTSQTPYTSRVALVPFSDAVNVGSYFTAIHGFAPTGSWTSVVERAGATNATEDPPASARFPDYYSMHSSARSPTSFIATFEKNRSSNSPATGSVVPLSSNKTTLKNAISAYAADGATAGHIGTAWAWYTLSPNWSAIWTGTTTPAAYGATVSKVAVLMSDFDFNVYYQGAVGDMSAQAQTLCTAMKAAGVTVYTVGFQVDHSNATALNLFTGCASDSSKAIEATNGAELIAAFDTVANTVVANVSSSIRLAR